MESQRDIPYDKLAKFGHFVLVVSHSLLHQAGHSFEMGEFRTSFGGIQFAFSDVIYLLSKGAKVNPSLLLNFQALRKLVLYLLLRVFNLPDPNIIFDYPFIEAEYLGLDLLSVHRQGLQVGCLVGSEFPLEFLNYLAHAVEAKLVGLVVTLGFPQVVTHSVDGSVGRSESVVNYVLVICKVTLEFVHLLLNILDVL